MEKERLTKAFVSALTVLLKERGTELCAFMAQDAFSHMTMSVAHWHADLYWNLASRDDMELEDVDDLDAEEFIILSDFERHKAINALMCHLEEVDQMESQDDDVTPQVMLIHEALAQALRHPDITQTIQTLAGDKEFDDLADIIHVKDVDGAFRHNFLAG